MRLRPRAYDSHDNTVQYGMLDNIFGPKITGDELIAIEARAVCDDWYDWFQHILQMRSQRKRNWLLAFIRDDVITIHVHTVYLDAYDDEDPYEGMG